MELYILYGGLNLPSGHVRSSCRPMKQPHVPTLKVKEALTEQYGLTLLTSGPNASVVDLMA